MLDIWLKSKKLNFTWHINAFRVIERLERMNILGGQNTECVNTLSWVERENWILYPHFSSRWCNGRVLIISRIDQWTRHLKNNNLYRRNLITFLQPLCNRYYIILAKRSSFARAFFDIFINVMIVIINFVLNSTGKNI